VQTLRAADIVNPDRLPVGRQLDVCVQCHESNHSTLRGDRGEFSFRPGEAVSSYRVNLVGDPAEPDRFILLAHPERMVRSACWKGSGGKLVCTSCHDPHKSSFDQPASWWDDKCKACHADKPCTETPQARAAENDHCITCHMRTGPPTSPSLVTITDHWIQKRPPPVRAGSDKPARLVAWPDLVGDPSPGPDLDAAVAAALAREGHPEDAERIAPVVVEQHVHTPELLDWLAGHYAAGHQPRNVARALAAILRFEPDAQETLHQYARIMLDVGPAGEPEARLALARMLALDPDDPSALETEAMYLFRAGQVEQARPLFAHAAAQGPMSAVSHVALGVLAKREGHDAEAIAELESARRIEPGDAWILEQLSAAYARTGDTAHAEAIERARKFFAAKGTPAATNATRWLPNAWR
jgi:Flp pilus assembly protein TadD